jgi:hypothetical protein
MMSTAFLLCGIVVCLLGGLLAFSALDYRLPEFRDQWGMLAFWDQSKFLPEGQRSLGQSRRIQLVGLVLVVVSFFV